MIDVIRSVNDDLNAIWQNREDKGRDTWRTLLKDAKEALKTGGVVQGDCDDKTLTALALAAARGVPERDLFFVVVRTPKGRGHAVAAYQDGGRWLLFGDTLWGDVRHYDRFYKVVKFLRMDRDHVKGWQKPV